MIDYRTPEGFDEKKAVEKPWTMKDEVYPSKTTGTDRKCHVILPFGYSANQTYPVLYLLHGIGGTEDEWLGGNPVEVLSNLAAEGKVKDMIVVIPNVRAAADDRVPQEVYGPENCVAFDNFINDLKDDLKPYIEAHYSVKTGRDNTAIAGLSMGGRESLYIATKMPETFAYVGAFSPAPGLLSIPNMPFPGMLEASALCASAPEPKFLMLCYGEQDMIVQMCAKAYDEALTANGVKHETYTMPGGHDFGVWKNGLYHFASRIF